MDLRISATTVASCAVRPFSSRKICEALNCLAMTAAAFLMASVTVALSVLKPPGIASTKPSIVAFCSGLRVCAFLASTGLAASSVATSNALRKCICTSRVAPASTAAKISRMQNERVR